MWGTTAFAAASRSGGERELSITVRVYDYAHLRRGTLIAAEERAASIFREVGLAMRWCSVPTDSSASLMDSSCDQPEGRAGLELRIVPGLQVVPGHTTDSTMGFAVGSLATVSYHWVENAVPSGVATPAEILACVVSHEIGHLLLGPNSHSPTGIMMGKWSPEELHGARWGRLLFTPKQAELIRAAVLARSGERRG